MALVFGEFSDESFEVLHVSGAKIDCKIFRLERHVRIGRATA